MNIKVKRKWVEALRSEKYKQTTGMLMRDPPDAYSAPSYCALGVLCKITGYFDLPDSERPGGWSWVNSAGVYADVENTLVRMNDHDKMSFGQIADYVEANL